ncbi:MAG: hypothetical protein GY944_27420, partial [bacterium]|nr:hypothetical protein [bacterium]
LMVECMLALQRTPGVRSGALAGGLSAAMVLTRPESLPLLLAVPGLVFVAHRGTQVDLRGWLRGFMLVGWLPVVAHITWRIGYYGVAFPNTFYAKATGELLARFSGGLRDIGRFLFVNPWSFPLALWVLLGFAGLSTLRLAARPRPQTVCWLGALWLMVVFRVSFDLWSGSDTMGRHRFLAPAIVPLVILADEGARMAWRGAGRGVVALLFCAAILFNMSGHREHVATIDFYRRGLERAHISLGHWLRERHPQGALLAIADAGAVPYFSGLETIDLWGLNDATIAHMPGEYGSKDGMPEYVLGRKPDVVVLWNQRPFIDAGQGRVVGGQPLDHAIASHPSFAQRYRYVNEFVFRRQRQDYPGYYLDVFERRNARADDR